MDARCWCTHPTTSKAWSFVLTGTTGNRQISMDSPSWCGRQPRVKLHEEPAGAEHGDSDVANKSAGHENPLSVGRRATDFQKDLGMA